MTQGTGSSEQEARLVAWSACGCSRLEVLSSFPRVSLLAAVARWGGASPALLPPACMCRGAAWAEAAAANPPARLVQGCILCVMALADTLDQAARKGDEAAVRQLLAEGVRPDQATAYGWLPLHFASFNGHQRVARLLLEAAPDTALAVDDYGWTPLHHLGYRGDIEVLKLLLLAAPAAATVLDAKKWAPIHHAAYRSNAASVQLLLEAAPEVAFALDDFGRTPLHLVLLYANHRMTEQVVETARCLLRAAPAVQPALGILCSTASALPPSAPTWWPTCRSPRSSGARFLLPAPTWLERCQPSCSARRPRRGGWWGGWGRTSASGCEQQHSAWCARSTAVQCCRQS